MISTLLAFMKRIFNWPDLDALGKSFSQSVHHHLTNFERRMRWYFIVILIVQIISLGLICHYFEKAFHWKYLIQI